MKKSELSRNRYGFGVSGMAVSRHSVKAVEYLFSLSLSSLPCVGFTLRKSLPKQGQSTFRYTFISLAVPRKIEPFPEFPTNVPNLTSPSLHQSLWPGQWERPGSDTLPEARKSGQHGWEKSGKGGIIRELTTQIKEDGGAARNIKRGENCALPCPSHTAMRGPSRLHPGWSTSKVFWFGILSLLLVYLHIVGF